MSNPEIKHLNTDHATVDETLCAQRPPTILKILQCSNLGGMEQVAYSLMRELKQKKGFRFHVTTPRPFGEGKPMLQAVDPGCLDFQYKGKFGWRSLPSFRRHVSRIAQEASRIWITGTCACSLAAVKSLPQRKILAHHYHHFGERAAWLRWFGFYHLLCRDLDAITYPTHFTRNEALTIAPWLRPRTHVAPYGYELAYADEGTRLLKQRDARRRLNLPTEAFVVGNAGWLIRRKRFDVFLHTARRIKEKLPRAFFVICGGGPLERELKDLAKTLGLAECVRFTGWVRETEVYYQAWDLCLFNSDLDALGRTPMEAASHGCLVAASVVRGGLSEFLDHGRNGILLPCHDVDLLAREVADLAKAPQKALEFRQAAAERLKENYSPQKSLDFHYSLLGA